MARRQFSFSLSTFAINATIAAAGSLELSWKNDTGFDVIVDRDDIEAFLTVAVGAHPIKTSLPRTGNPYAADGAATYRFMPNISAIRVEEFINGQTLQNNVPTLATVRFARVDNPPRRGQIVVGNGATYKLKAYNDYSAALDLIYSATGWQLVPDNTPGAIA